MLGDSLGWHRQKYQHDFAVNSTIVTPTSGQDNYPTKSDCDGLQPTSDGLQPKNINNANGRSANSELTLRPLEPTSATRVFVTCVDTQPV